MKNINLYSLKKNKSSIKRINITCSKDIQEFVRQFYSDDINIYESFFLVLLDRSNTTIGCVKISQGGINGTFVDTRLIGKYALDSLASSVILCHNHPSGNLKASNEDDKITNKIKKSLGLFDINVLDHIILTEDDYYSFADNDKL